MRAWYRGRSGDDSTGGYRPSATSASSLGNGCRAPALLRQPTTRPPTPTHSGNADGKGVADLPLRISQAAPGYTVAVDVWPLRLAVRAGLARPVSCHSEWSRRSVLSSCLVVTRHRMHALVGPVP